jgi:hypothetical protein
VEEAGSTTVPWSNAHAKQLVSVDLIDEMRKDADEQIERSNARKKLADAAQPLHSSLADKQKRRSAHSCLMILK